MKQILEQEKQEIEQVKVLRRDKIFSKLTFFYTRLCEIKYKLSEAQHT